MSSRSVVVVFARAGLTALVAVGCGGGDAAGPPAGSDDPATLRFAAQTAGADTDLDGYIATATRGSTTFETPLAIAGSSSLEVRAGSYVIDLTEVAGNCQVVAGAPKTVEAAAGSTVQLDIQVNCADIPPLEDQIVVAVWAASGGLFVMNPDGSNRRRLTTASLGAHNHPHVSADGKRIVYVTHAPTGDEIRIVNADGTEATGVIATGLWPRWSPDGALILFQTRVDSLPDVHVMQPDGTALLNLSDSQSSADTDAEWSPDGSTIVFRSTRECCTLGDLYLMDPNGGGLTRITRPDGNAGDFNPKWSPDATRIAFVSNRSGKWRVWIMNADGSDPVQLIPDSPAHGAGCNTCGDFVMGWSPAGDRILFKREISTVSQEAEIYIFDLQSGVITQLTDNFDDDHAATWSR